MIITSSQPNYNCHKLACYDPADREKERSQVWKSAPSGVKFFYSKISFTASNDSYCHHSTAKFCVRDCTHLTTHHDLIMAQQLEWIPVRLDQHSLTTAACTVSFCRITLVRNWPPPAIFCISQTGAQYKFRQDGHDSGTAKLSAAAATGLTYLHSSMLLILSWAAAALVALGHYQAEPASGKRSETKKSIVGSVRKLWPAPSVTHVVGAESGIVWGWKWEWWWRFEWLWTQVSSRTGTSRAANLVLGIVLQPEETTRLAT